MTHYDNLEALKFVAATHTDVSSIAAPLKQLLNITHFNFRRTYLDGRRSLLTNDPQWLEHYYGIQSLGIKVSVLQCQTHCYEKTLIKQFVKTSIVGAV